MTSFGAAARPSVWTSGERSRGDPDRAPWQSAAKCWEALEMVGPLRDVLCSVLNQPRHAWGGVGPPPRVVAAIHTQSPSAKELARLHKLCASMGGALVEIQRQLEEHSTLMGNGANRASAASLPEVPEPALRHVEKRMLQPPPLDLSRALLQANMLADGDVYPYSAGASTTVGDGSACSHSFCASSTLGGWGHEVYAVPAASDIVATPTVLVVGTPLIPEAGDAQLRGQMAGAETSRVEELEGLCRALSARAAHLEANREREADLQSVADQLRRKVESLEQQDANINTLSSECASLRLRIQGLVATAQQTDEEHKALCSQVRGASDSQNAVRRRSHEAVPLIQAALRLQKDCKSEM